MAAHRAATAAELQRKITDYLPVFARPMLDALIARVREEERRRRAEADQQAQELTQ